MLRRINRVKKSLLAPSKTSITLHIRIILKFKVIKLQVSLHYLFNELNDR